MELSRTVITRQRIRSQTTSRDFQTIALILAVRANSCQTVLALVVASHVKVSNLKDGSLKIISTVF